NAGGTNILTLVGPATLGGNYTLTIPTITANDTICTVGAGNCTGGGGGVTTVGTIDSQTPSSNGAVISGTSIYLQSASATNPGLVNTTTQTFAGAKTVKVNSTSAFQVQNASAAVVLNADTTNMRVDVGSLGTATSQLYVSGNLPSTYTGTASTG